MAGPSPALCQPRAGQRNRGPNFPKSSTTAQPRTASVLLYRYLPHSASVPARASCRLTQLRCWVAPSPEVSSPASGPAHFLRSRSSVRLRRGHTWPLFLQALRHFCSAGGPRVRTASLRSVLGENAAKPSGRPGHGRPGRWRRQCQSSRLCSAAYAAAQNLRCPPQTARFSPHQRRYVLHLFEGLCLFAKTVVPRIRASESLTPLGRPGPGR